MVSIVEEPMVMMMKMMILRYLLEPFDTPYVIDSLILPEEQTQIKREHK